MKAVVRFALVSTMLVGANSLNAQTQVTPAARAVGPLADSLRAFAHNMADIFRRLDTQRSLALYGGRAHFVHVDDGNIEPWAQLERDMRQYFATVKSNPVYVVGEPGVIIMDVNNAVLYVTHRMEANEGRPAHEGVWTGVLHRFPDGWKIVHSHSSDRRPPP